MTPKEAVTQWIGYFNAADAASLASLYDANATNHQMPFEPVVGREAIQAMFEREFANATMVCIPVQILEDGEWAALEWTDPLGLCGCGFFQVRDGKICMQRGYWDRMTFDRLHRMSES